MSISPAPGVVLDGRYKLLGPLGHGGMGTVWRAQHVKLGTPVAIKLIGPSIAASADVLARFTREAQLAAALESPNVVRVLDFGIERETPYIAMELLSGETLGARLGRRAPLAHAETRSIVQQVARGLGCAHQAGVVHCDLKPENVFLAVIDGDEIAKVLDFGVAKAPLSGELDPLTRTGAVLGTLQYMSPEQLESRKKVDLRSDLYALAVIVFECVTGRPAFSAESIGEIVRKICVAPLPVPSHVAQVPTAFDAWFARAAHRDPAARFASAREMSEALGAALASPAPAPVASPPSSAGARARASRSKAEIEPTMRGPVRGGNERSGYTILPDLATRVLHFEMWGLWDEPTAQAFRSDVLRAYDVLDGAPWVALNAAQRYPPQKAEVQRVHRECMAAGKQRGLTRVALLVDATLSQMQIRRLFEESGDPSIAFFQSEPEARAWLAKGAASDGQATVARGGNESSGYRVATLRDARLLELELWGLWDIPLTQAFTADVLRGFAALKGAPWVAFAIGTRHPPQRPEIQEIQGRTMGLAASYGMLRTAFVIEGELGKLAPRRLAREANMSEPRFFNTEQEARAWLAEAPIGRGGDQRAGFWVAADARARLLRLELWGLWDLSLARAFRTEIVRMIDAFEGAPWTGLSSHVRMPAQRDDVQEIQRETMTIAGQRGMVRAAVLVASGVGQLQVQRLTRESGTPSMRVFTDEGEAQSWLAEAR